MYFLKNQSEVRDYISVQTVEAREYSLKVLDAAKVLDRIVVVKYRSTWPNVLIINGKALFLEDVPGCGVDVISFPHLVEEPTASPHNPINLWEGISKTAQLKRL